MNYHFKNDTSNGQTKWVETTDKNTLKTDEAIFCIKETRTHSLRVKLTLNGTEVPFNVDTGAAVSIMSHSSMQQFLLQATLNTTKVTLQTYTAEPMKVKR